MPTTDDVINAGGIAGGGKVAIVGPDGWHGLVPESSLDQALKMGYRLESSGEHTERRLEEKYGSSPITAGLEGAARGATFGLSDVLLSDIAGSNQGLRERKERNAVAAGVGEVAGMVAPALLTGGGGLAGRLGTAAAEKVAGSAAIKGLAAEGGSLLARAAAKAAPTLARGGAEGALFGLGTGVSDVALSKDPMGAEAVIATLGSHAAVGAGLGIGAGAAGEILGAAIGKAGKAAGKLADGIKGRMAAEVGDIADPILGSGIYDKAGLDALRKAEVDALAAQRAVGGKQIADEVKAFREEYRDFGVRMVKQLPKGQGLGRELIQSERSLQNVVGDLKSLAEDPGRALGALRRQEQQLTGLSERLPASETLQAVIERNVALQTRISEFAGAGKTSERLAAIDAKLEALDRPMPGAGLTKKAVGAGIGALVGSVVPGGSFVGGLIGKEVAEYATGALMKKLTGAFAEKATAIGDAAKGIFSSGGAGPKSAMSMLGGLASAASEKGGSTFARASSAIAAAAANIDATRTQIHETLNGLRAADPLLADQVETGLVNQVQFLATKVPRPTSAIGSIADGFSGAEPPDADKARFARYVAAALDPLGRITAEIRSRQVASETVETLGALYPEMLQRLQSKITTQLADPLASARLAYPVRLALSQLLGTPADSTLRPQFVNAMQATFAAKPDQPKSHNQPQRGQPTQGQRLAGG